MNNSETLQGSYTLVKMPDGSEVLMHKLANGEWVTTKERAEKSLTDSFKGTETVPNNWKPHDSSNLVKKTKNIEDLIRVSPVHRHLHAHLIEMLGIPEEIVKNGKLNETIKGKTIKDYTFKRHVEQTIKAIDAEPWLSVLKIINGDKS